MNTVPLLLGVVFSSIGLGYFIYGKKQQQTMPLICGIALMIYPYFIENTVFFNINWNYSLYCTQIYSFITWPI